MMLKQGANNIDTLVKMFKGENPEKKLNSAQLSLIKHERTWAATLQSRCSLK